MEESVIEALVQSLAHEGPGWLLALGALVIGAGVAVRALPLVRELKLGQLDLERDREKRKDRESRQREEHDRESATMQGRWLEQQARSNAALEASNRAAVQQNAVTEGIRVQLESLNQNLADSKEHSHQMGQRVDTMATQVQDIHDHILSGKGLK